MDGRRMRNLLALVYAGGRAVANGTQVYDLSRAARRWTTTAEESCTAGTMRDEKGLNWEPGGVRSRAGIRQLPRGPGSPDRGHQGSQPIKGSEGAGGVAAPDEGYWCQYATDWTEVKMEWGLTMTQRETEAVIEMLDTCEEPVEVEAESAEGAAGTDTSGHAAAGEATATPTLVPELEPGDNIPPYESCEEAAKAGESRVQGSAGGGRGFPQAMVPSARDGDGDGVVCER